MALIIKELVVKSTITDRKRERNDADQQQLKEEIIKACVEKMMRQIKRKNER